MPKSGQARVLTKTQQHHLFHVIKEHRYPETVFSADGLVFLGIIIFLLGKRWAKTRS